MTIKPRSIPLLTCTLLTSLLLSACATTGSAHDPLEGYNRAMFDINDGLDKVLIKPLAEGYEGALPIPIRQGVTNFFSNIDDVLVAINNLLQGKPLEAVSDLGRFTVNSTLGILGVIDVASELGLEKHEEDFGQTMGRWGMGSGPYLVLPLLGPSTLRDGIGKAADIAADPVAQIDEVSRRNMTVAVRALNDRAGLLSADKIIEQAALDRYTYVRDAYLQRRRSLIYDGEPPRENYAEDYSAVPALTPALATGIEAQRVQGSANLYVEYPLNPSPLVVQSPAATQAPAFAFMTGVH